MTGHFVEELIHRFEVEQQKNDRSGIYALTQRMMAYNSNKIEGSTLTEKQTASLFDTGTLSSENAVIRAKDVEEMTGHFLMFNEMLKTYDYARYSAYIRDKSRLSLRDIPVEHYNLKLREHQKGLDR